MDDRTPRPKPPMATPPVVRPAGPPPLPPQHVPIDSPRPAPVQPGRPRYCVTCGGDLPGVGVFCPHCGTPLVPSAMQIGTDDRPAVIERTAKKWKLMQLIGFFIALVAFIAVVLMLRAEADYATKKREPTDTHLFFRWLFSATILLGIAVGLYGRLKAWWHHG